MAQSLWWWFSVYCTAGAVVILLLSATQAFAGRWRRAIAVAEGKNPADRLTDLILFAVVTLMLLAWPTIPATIALRRFRRGRSLEHRPSRD